MFSINIAIFLTYSQHLAHKWILASKVICCVPKLYFKQIFFFSPFYDYKQTYKPMKINIYAKQNVNTYYGTHSEVPLQF